MMHQRQKHRSGASVADPKAYRSGRNFRRGSGSCRSNTRAGARTSSAVSANRAMTICRGLFTAGALAVIHGTKHRPWLTAFAGPAANESRRDRACPCRSC
jgi:hypothetical protein